MPTQRPHRLRTARLLVGAVLLAACSEAPLGPLPEAAIAPGPSNTVTYANNQPFADSVNNRAYYAYNKVIEYYQISQFTTQATASAIAAPLAYIRNATNFGLTDARAKLVEHVGLVATALSNGRVGACVASELTRHANGIIARIDQALVAPYTADMTTLEPLAPCPVLASIIVSPASANVVQGSVTTFTAQALDAFGQWPQLDPNIPGRQMVWYWSVDKPGKVSLSTTQSPWNPLQVTALDTGTVTIYAQDFYNRTITGVATLTIGLPPITSVQVLPPALTVPVGQSAPLTVELRDANGTLWPNRPVTWSSSNAAVASVNGAGIVTAHAAGSAIITATSGAASGTATVTVPTVPVDRFEVSPGSIVMGQRETRQLTVTAYDAGNNVLTDRVALFSSNNAAVAAVSSTGLVSSTNPGGAVITVQVEGLQRTVPVSVTLSPLVSADIVETRVILQPGEEWALSTIYIDATGHAAWMLAPRVLTAWTSSAPVVAGVSSGGKILSATEGETLITMSVEGFSDQARAIVRRPVGSVQVTPDSADVDFSVDGPYTVQLSATWLDDLGNVIPMSPGWRTEGRSIAWSTTSPVATVDANGLVTVNDATAEPIVVTATVTDPYHVNAVRTVQGSARLYVVGACEFPGLGGGVSDAVKDKFCAKHPDFPGTNRDGGKTNPGKGNGGG